MKGFEANLAASVQAQLISRTEVLKSFIAETDGTAGATATEALVRASVLTHGVEHGNYFREQYDCTALAARSEPGKKWLVRGVEFKKAPQPGLPKFVQARTIKYEGNRLTLSMLVRNEAGRYLRKVLEHAAQYIDNAVILDDASEDNTVDVCKEALRNVPLTIVSNPRPSFNNEVGLRKQQWELVTATNPDWILTLDADEMLEDRAKSVVRNLINQPFYDHYSFRLYDFWSPTHYREDPYWQAHKTYRILLVRYQPGFAYTWQETPLHCGRLPNNMPLLPGALTDLRVKHFGWATQSDREVKYRRYKALDPAGRYGILQQYESILDPRPNLVEWVEQQENVTAR
ncbi:MAG: glycosyltransferase family 2 protein [Bacillota bacterium]